MTGKASQSDKTAPLLFQTQPPDPEGFLECTVWERYAADISTRPAEATAVYGDF